MSTDADHRLIQELSITRVSPLTARVMTLLFLLIVVSVPLAGLRHARLAGSGPKEWMRSAAGYEVLHDTLVTRFGAPLQRQLTSRLKFGNTLIALGRDGWLFYTPGLDLIGGPAMLDRDWLALRRKTAMMSGNVESHPDPRPAILQFARDCARAGAALILVPIPDKSMLQPAQLSSRWRGGPTPTNPDWPRFVAEMRGNSVNVLDVLVSPGETGKDRFLRRDSHWAPDWMEAVAGSVAALARETVTFDPPPRPFSCTTAPQPLTASGDLVDLLGVAGKELFELDSIVSHRVEIPDVQGPLAPRPDVLLLGDSLTEVFESASFGWGSSAGFGRHLMRQLGRQVDVIAGPGYGPTKARQRLAARANPLKGVKLVVWQFAMRELVLGDWRPVPIGE